MTGRRRDEERTTEAEGERRPADRDEEDGQWKKGEADRDEEDGQWKKGEEGMGRHPGTDWKRRWTGRQERRLWGEKWTEGGTEREESRQKHQTSDTQTTQGQWMDETVQSGEWREKRRAQQCRLDGDEPSVLKDGLPEWSDEIDVGCTAASLVLVEGWSSGSSADEMAVRDGKRTTAWCASELGVAGKRGRCE